VIRSEMVAEKAVCIRDKRRHTKLTVSTLYVETMNPKLHWARKVTWCISRFEVCHSRDNGYTDESVMVVKLSGELRLALYWRRQHGHFLIMSVYSG
jgi:hypothetical protein